MPHPPPDPLVSPLPEAFAKRLLTRASELDAATSSSAAIADLRAAAAEAGISERAFDAALAELRSGDRAAVPAATTRRRGGRVILGAMIALLTLGGLAYVRERALPAPPTSLLTEERLLRCISSDEAAVLIRALLPLPTNTIAFRPDPQRSGSVLRVQGTQDQLRQVNAELDRYEASGAGACPAPPSRPVVP